MTALFAGECLLSVQLDMFPKAAWAGEPTGAMRALELLSEVHQIVFHEILFLVTRVLTVRAFERSEEIIRL